MDTTTQTARLDRALAGLRLAHRDHLAHEGDRVELCFFLRAKIAARKAGATEQQIAKALSR